MPNPRPRRPRTSRRLRRGSPLLRMRIGFLVIAFVLSIFGARLFQLQALDSRAYADMAAAEGAVKLTLPARRGEILDRNGLPLASSQDALMVVADPSKTKANAAELATFLAKELQLDYFDLLSRLQRTDTRFQYIARRVPATIATKVVNRAEDKGWLGLDTRWDPARTYPAKDVAANIVGFLGTPDPRSGTRPLAGMELQFNKRLSGKDGSEQYQVGAGNRIPLGDSTTVDPVDGKDLSLTVDQDLQWYVQRVLRQSVEDTRSLSGAALVMDTRTGELLAMADYPTYDATKPLESDEDDLGSRAVSEPYEPGSVEKALTFASLLDAGKVTPETRFKVPGRLDRQDSPIKDWFEHGMIRLTATGVLAQSSNIGTVLAADALSGPQLNDYLRAFGLGEKSGLGVRGETAGIIPSGVEQTPQIKDRMAFGQSMSTSAVQMTAAINTIANGGKYVSPSLIKGSATTDSGRQVGTDTTTTRQVVSERAAEQTAQMMEKVIDPEDGVAPGAAVPGYRVAGKTGTSQRVGESGTYDGTYSMSFAGFAPADEPRFTVYVVLHAPEVEGGGGSLAGPIFSKVMGFALRRYGVEPTGTKPPDLPVEWTPRDR